MTSSRWYVCAAFGGVQNGDLRWHGRAHRRARRHRAQRRRQGRIQRDAERSDHAQTVVPFLHGRHRQRRAVHAAARADAHGGGGGIGDGERKPREILQLDDAHDARRARDGGKACARVF